MIVTRSLIDMAIKIYNNNIIIPTDLYNVSRDAFEVAWLRLSINQHPPCQPRLVLAAGKDIKKPTKIFSAHCIKLYSFNTTSKINATFETYDVFPLPVGPMMAFSPWGSKPLYVKKQNAAIMTKTATAHAFPRLEAAHLTELRITFFFFSPKQPLTS